MALTRAEGQAMAERWLSETAVARDGCGSRCRPRWDIWGRAT